MLLVCANTETSPYAVFPLRVAFIEAALKLAGNAVRVSGTSKRSEELIAPCFFSPKGFSNELREREIVKLTLGLENWFVSDHCDNNAGLIAQLRAKVKQGLLWEYLPISRRLANQPA